MQAFWSNKFFWWTSAEPKQAEEGVGVPGLKLNQDLEIALKCLSCLESTSGKFLLFILRNFGEKRSGWKKKFCRNCNEQNKPELQIS